MEFKPYRGGWASKLKMDLNPSRDGRKDKTVITKQVPNRAIEQGGENLSLVDFYMKLNGCTAKEAIQTFARITGVELPEMADMEKYRAYKEKQDRLEKMASRMKRALWSDPENTELAYLTEERGYSGDTGKKFIDWAQFGRITKDMTEEIEELRDLFTYTDQSGEEHNTFPKGVGETYTLVIPYRSGGNIQGFIFRSVLDDEHRAYTDRSGEKRTWPKYKDAFISASASKKFHLFGLTGINLTGNAERDRDIVIVEGEIDALRTAFAGIENVVAASSSGLSPEAVEEAKSRGVQRATLLFDTEDTEERREENHRKVKKAVAVIQKAGLSAFVCYLPSSEGAKTDPDSYLKDHTPEELRAEIEQAPSAARFLFEDIIGPGGTVYDKDLNEAKRRVIDLANDIYTPATERGILFRLFEECTGGHITKEDLQEEADLYKMAEERNRQREETVSVAAEALKLARDGKTEEAIAVMGDRASELRRISMESEYSKLLTLPSESEIERRFSERPTGTETQYYFKGREEPERFALPNGALTYICAPTSHGKSRMLENLALYLAQNGETGDVLYFTFEEDKTAVEEQCLNIFLNTRLAANNLRTINSYYRNPEDRYHYFAGKGEADFGQRVLLFESKKKEYLQILTSGRLNVIHENYDSDQLMEAIRYYRRQKPVKAVFVDYIQLLHKRGTRLQRKEELATICKSFMELAVDTGLPIVLAAQLNREAYSPIDMEVQNIAEASEIEHSANTVLLLWNSSTNPIPQKSSYYTYRNKKRVLSDEAEKLESRGFKIGEEGTMYARIAKNRGGQRNIDAVLKFNGNTGVIDPDPSILPERQTTETGIQGTLYNQTVLEEDPF